MWVTREGGGISFLWMKLWWFTFKREDDNNVKVLHFLCQIKTSFTILLNSIKYRSQWLIFISFLQKEGHRPANRSKLVWWNGRWEYDDFQETDFNWYHATTFSLTSIVPYIWPISLKIIIATWSPPRKANRCLRSWWRKIPNGRVSVMWMASRLIWKVHERCLRYRQIQDVPDRWRSRLPFCQRWVVRNGSIRAMEKGMKKRICWNETATISHHKLPYYRRCCKWSLSVV